MIRKASLGVAFAVLILAPGASFAGVKVRFIDPEHYTDAGSFGTGSRKATLAAFRTYFQKLGERFLAPGQTLTIDVLDIDLAGEYEPWRTNFSDIRIMRDTTPPSFRLRYVLTERGKRMRSGEENLMDINYQMNASARLSGGRYAYEKALLDDWFRRNFADRRDEPPRRF